MVLGRFVGGWLEDVVDEWLVVFVDCFVGGVLDGFVCDLVVRFVLDRALWRNRGLWLVAISRMVVDISVGYWS